jgi:hypothetical protein
MGARCGGEHLLSHLLQRLRQENYKFGASLDYIARPYLKIKKKVIKKKKKG